MPTTNLVHLRAQLVNSGFQKENPALFQSVNGLIDAVQALGIAQNTQFVGINSSTTQNLITTINNLIINVSKLLNTAVIGPASSINHDVALFSGTTGKLVQDAPYRTFIREFMFIGQ